MLWPLIARGNPLLSSGSLFFVERVSTSREFRIFIVNKSVTADGSLLSPTGGVNTIHPARDIHEHFTIQHATEHCAQPEAHLQQSWAHCDQLHEHHNAHWREHCVVLSTLRTVFRCIALMRSYVTLAQVSSVCPHFHPWSSACALVLECSLHPVSLLLPQVLLPPLPDSCHGAWRDFHGRSLCNSSFGSMVSMDYVTPDRSQPANWTRPGCQIRENKPILCRRMENKGRHPSCTTVAVDIENVACWICGSDMWESPTCASEKRPRNIGFQENNSAADVRAKERLERRPRNDLPSRIGLKRGPKVGRAQWIYENQPF